MTTVSSLTALHAPSQFPRNIPRPKKDSEPNENYPAPCLKKSALHRGKNGMYFFLRPHAKNPSTSTSGISIAKGHFQKSHFKKKRRKYTYYR
mgnify:CR=1 FL=1